MLARTAASSFPSRLAAVLQGDGERAAANLEQHGRGCSLLSRAPPPRRLAWDVRGPDRQSGEKLPRALVERVPSEQPRWASRRAGSASTATAGAGAGATACAKGPRAVSVCPATTHHDFCLCRAKEETETPARHRVVGAVNLG